MVRNLPFELILGNDFNSLVKIKIMYSNNGVEIGFGINPEGMKSNPIEVTTAKENEILLKDKIRTYSEVLKTFPRKRLDYRSMLGKNELNIKSMPIRKGDKSNKTFDIHLKALKLKSPLAQFSNFRTKFELINKVLLNKTKSLSINSNNNFYNVKNIYGKKVDVVNVSTMKKVSDRYLDECNKGDIEISEFKLYGKSESDTESETIDIRDDEQLKVLRGSGRIINKSIKYDL